MKVWADGKIQDTARTIDSLNFSLHYASPCVWEGIRVYDRGSVGRAKAFKLSAHIRRLFDSAKIMGFEIPYEHDELMNACKQLIRECGGGDLYIRPIAYSSNDAKNAKPQVSKINVDIYAFPIKPLHQDKDGIKVGISSYVRGYPQFQMQAKTAANYHFLQTVKGEMERLGVDDMLMTDNQGYITEATVANIWVFKNGQAVTPPNDGSILPGITRATVYEMLRQLGIPVSEKKITRADIYTADEVILCGTYAEIVKVSNVDGRQISGDKFYQHLRKSYTKLTRGS